MRGFTLIEVLVVLLLASLMLLLVPPLFSGSVMRVSMNSTTDQMASSLRRARSRAVAHARSVPWILDLQDKYYQIGEQGNAKYLDDEIKISLTTARSEVQEEGVKAAIRFYPDGGATGGEISLKRGDIDKTISVDWLTGRVNVH